ncbi:MAG TPA: XylR family transcriptional regulator [Planctomicrobium sp.]|nr:XylR family transcriptional regulator [Planctomicrobium sp.]
MAYSRRPPRHVAVLIETSRGYGRGLLEGVTRYCREVGNWLIDFEPRGIEGPPKWLADWKGDGILSRLPDRTMADSLKRLKVPIVHLHHTSAGSWPMVGADNQSVAELAFRHLKEKGIRHFAYCGLPPGYSQHQDDRGEQFRQRAEASGYECSIFAVHRRTGLEMSDWTGEQKDIIRWLKLLPKPVGIFACFDERAFQVLEACRQAQLRVPEEIAVIGAGNDVLLCNMSTPPMTSIDLNATRIGYEAASLLDRIMEGKKKSNQQRWVPALRVVARGSTDMLAVEDPDVVAALQFMKKHATRGLQIRDLLKHVHLSQAVLERKFKANLGRTPKAEMMRLQIQQAGELLMESTLPVKTIARNCGFNSERYFSDAFRRATGMRPAAFRKQRH